MAERMKILHEMRPEAIMPVSLAASDADGVHNWRKKKIMKLSKEQV